ncbi:DUF1801 domain-containing protein [Herbiconiux sp. L3-i23]|uniref:DUF1801 domain-containing protein n=1 Tax=Herbiconiux sp. L3-i23 TaxID=2905871 RepID=UPI00205EF762|nr:DUF1801 domain-containing protein [Herbiconiux sp. L3-i23]BDI24080.1 hypothetical protein L3i23_28560 [Herbiconiux sp. L3-i23]
MSAATAPTPVDVDEFLRAVPDERRRAEGFRLKDLFEHVTGLPAVMWGPSMVGFGAVHYKYASGREGDTFLVGFSPRKTQLTLYGLYSAYDDEPDPLFEQLGTYTTGKGCVYLKRLEDVDIAVLETLVRNVVAAATESADGAPTTSAGTA